MEFELAGVVRYTHYSLMVTGPNRIPIVQFMKAQATESLLHAQQAGEILTGIDGHPSQRIADIEETYQHNLADILRESLNHEERALDLYKKLLDVVKDASIYIEEYARSMIGQEELHGLELRKMLRDYGSSQGHRDDAAAHRHGSHDEKERSGKKKDRSGKKKDKGEKKAKGDKPEKQEKKEKAAKAAAPAVAAVSEGA